MAESQTPKTIVIQGSGTRGDAQPLVAVALKLQKEGYDVTVLTNKDSVDFVESCGMKARHVFPDLGWEISNANGTHVKASSTGNLQDLIAAKAVFNKKYGPTTTKLWFEAVTEIKPDLCISGSSCDLLGMVMMRHFKIPTVMVGLQAIPIDPPKMIMGLPNIPCCGMNKFIANHMSNKVAQGEIDGFGAELKKQFDIDFSKLFTKQELAEKRAHAPPAGRMLLGVDPLIAHVLYGGAEHVPKNVKLLGFFAVDSEKQVNVAGQGEVQRQKSNQFGAKEELEAIGAFCAEDKPPVYLGFGSMTVKSPEHMVVLLCQAVKHAGARAIISKGWAKLNQTLLEKSTKDAALIDYVKANIMFVGNTPHEWLFPKCSCIVHHGGAGTTSTASRARVPQIIIPVWLDQWDFSHFLNVYGAGFGFSKQLLKVTAQEVGDAINNVQADEKMKAKAKEWGDLAVAQRGTNGFVEELRAWWDQEVVTGKFTKYNEECVKAINK